MKTYKGFNKDMTCRDFQYEEGKEYEIKEEIACCENGFHACEYPLDCLGYYAPSQSVYHEVEQDGQISRRPDTGDSKIASSKIKIGAAVSIAGLVKASFEYIKARTIKSKSNHSKADYSANSATGDRSANSATGYGSANLTTGEDCKNDGLGEANISIGWGRNNKCKGCVGSYLVLSEWGNWDGNKYPLIGAQMALVDGEKIKADTYYILKDGKITEATED